MITLPPTAEGRTLKVALLLFALAGITGALFRFVVAYGVSTGLDPVNIRHAHSHLMYFGWVTPALFALVSSYVRRAGGEPVSGRLLAWTILLAVVTAAAFLPWGYAPAQFGSARIPITIILSTVCMLVWYGWLAWYRRARVHVADRSVRLLWDSAAVFLGLSTLGAWSVAAFVPFGLASPGVKLLFAHLFLQYFAEGWFVLGLLGVAWTRLDRSVAVPTWAFALTVGGVAGGFLMSLPGSMIAPNTRLIAQLAGLAGGAGVLGLAWTWWRSAPVSERSSWGIPMLVLATKGATQAVAVLVPGVWWADMVPVRIVYLHVLLLGVVTLGLAATIMTRRTLHVFQGVVLATVAVLVPMTTLWPGGPAGAWTYPLAAWVSLAAPIVAVIASANRKELHVLLDDRSAERIGNQEEHDGSTEDTH